MPAKILIVDDDLQSLKLIGLMLQRRGHTITAAQSGAQALAKVESDVPDLVILDVMMPGIDGFEVCRRLRSDPRTSRVPIILFTAKNQVSDKVAGFQAGADDFLTKPVHPNELASRVDAALQRTLRIEPAAALSGAARVIGFLGVAGGVGTTTLALNVAAALANSTPASPVILADLQSSAANVAMQLRLESAGGLASLINSPVHEIDAARAASQLIRHSSGVLLLMSTPDLRASMTTLPEAQLQAIIRSLAQLGQTVLLDLGSTLDESTIAALQLCQLLVLVIEPQRLAVTVAQNMIAALNRRGIPSDRLVLALINHVAGAATLDKRTIESLLQLPVSSFIPPAPEAASEAVEQAALMIHLQPGSLIADQFRSLAQRLTT